MTFDDWAKGADWTVARSERSPYEAAKAAWEAATEAAAKECEDRAKMEFLYGPAYEQGCLDSAVFIRGSLTRISSSVMTNTFDDTSTEKEKL